MVSKMALALGMLVDIKTNLIVTEQKHERERHMNTQQVFNKNDLFAANKKLFKMQS